MVIFHSYVKLPDGISNLPIHVSPAMSIHVVSYHAVEFGTQISPPHFPALPMAAVLFRLGDVTVTIDDLVGGIPTSSEKYDFVSWDDDIPNIWKVIKIHGSLNHQPESIPSGYD